jgi:Flp pilus assembly protein TadG
VAAVEFALLLPLLLLLVIGAMDMGLALYDKAVITHASREGARAGIVLSSPKLTAPQIQSLVSKRLGAGLISPQATEDPAVTVSGAGAAYPATLTVSVEYHFRGVLLGSLMQALGTPWVIHASTAMVNE